MIAIPPGVRVLVAMRAVDFRKGAHGLAALYREAQIWTRQGVVTDRSAETPACEGVGEPAVAGRRGLRRRTARRGGIGRGCR